VGNHCIGGILNIHYHILHADWQGHFHGPLSKSQQFNARWLTLHCEYSPNIPAPKEGLSCSAAEGNSMSTSLGHQIRIQSHHTPSPAAVIAV